MLERHLATKLTGSLGRTRGAIAFTCCWINCVGSGGLASRSCVSVEHVSKDVLGVLETLDHLEVGRLHGAVKGIGATLALFVDVGDHLGLATEHDLGVVLEVDLHHLVREAEHDGVPSAHPLLHVHDVFHLAFFRAFALSVLLHHRLRLLVALKVRPEVLQQGNLLLQLFGVLGESVRLANILPITGAALHVVDVMTVRVENDLCGVIEENTCCLVAQVVAQAVLGRVVNPLLHPNLVLLGQSELLGFLCASSVSS